MHQLQLALATIYVASYMVAPCSYMHAGVQLPSSDYVQIITNDCFKNLVFTYAAQVIYFLVSLFEIMF